MNLKLQEFRNYIKNNHYKAAHLSYPADMEIIHSILFKPDLLTTKSITILTKYKEILNSDIPYFRSCKKEKQRNFNSAFSLYIDFVRHQNENSK